MQKLYYSISEVSKLVDEEQHILRYWEKQFGMISPRKNRAGNRVYSERDLLIIKAIKKLIRDEKLSLQGVKERLATMNFDKVPIPENIFSSIGTNLASNENDNSLIDEQIIYNDSSQASNNNEILKEVKNLLIDLKYYLTKN